MRRKRHAFRASWHDYNCGTYFVTVCTHEKQKTLGHIASEEMILSEAGMILEKCLQNVGDHYSDARMVCFVVMPNHFHAILDIGDQVARRNENEVIFSHYHARLSMVVAGIKAAVTKECRINGIDFKWQSRFHEHIIRTTDMFDNLEAYVYNNVKKWADDCFYDE